jgi:hypothetical protein
MVDDHQFGVRDPDLRTDLRNLSCAKQAGGRRFAQRDDQGRRNVEPDRLCEADRFGKLLRWSAPGSRTLLASPALGKYDYRTRVFPFDRL